MTLNDKFHEFVKESNPNTDKDWKDVFQKMAKYVFQNCHLETNRKKYYLTEIEFYYYSENNKHPDPWCYRKPNKNNDFLPSDSLWFHYSGMDITFDNKENNEYGGILIRGIQPAEEGNPTNGPLRSLYKLLNTKPQSDTKPVCLRLAYNEERNLPKDITSEERYGLNNASGEKKDYEESKYRFYLALEGVKIARNKTTPRM